jgi:hypothetical protein
MKFPNLACKDRWSLSLWLLLSGLACYLLYLHVEIILFPYPQEFREGHLMSTTKLLIDGINPYSLKVYPSYYNSYGILYNLVVYPFAYIFGCSLEIHRAINALFIFSSLGFIFISFKDIIKKNALLGATLGLLLYSLWLARETCLSRPDTLGIFLYLCSVIIPIKNKFSNRSLFWGGLCATLAFYTKSYFFSGWIAISAYIFLCIDYKKAIRINLLFLSIFLLLGFVVFKIMPLYFYETFFGYYGTTSVLFGYSIKQIVFFFLTVSPVLIYIVYLQLVASKGEKDKMFSLIKSTPYSLVFIVILGLLFFPLGTNDGAYLNYHYQLLLPVLVILILILQGSYNYIKYYKPILFLMTVFLIAQTVYLNRNFKTSIGDWGELEYFLSGKQNILNTPAIAPLLLRKNKTIYDSGVSGYGKLFRTSKITSALFGLDEDISRANEKYFQSINSQLSGKTFDALVLTGIDAIFYQQLDKSGYFLSKKIQLPLPHTMRGIELNIYEPIK